VSRFSDKAEKWLQLEEDPNDGNGIAGEEDGLAPDVA
jgi:hypothetical protein